MSAAAIDVLGEATELATMLVDQIEYVDLLDPLASAAFGEPAREEGPFYYQATEFVRGHRQREALKRTIAAMSRKTRQSELALKLLEAHEVPAACELVTSAVKGLLMAGSHNMAWLRQRRLILKFSSIEAPWVQDPRRSSSIVTPD